MLKFTETHEWIEEKDGIGTVGITQHAQKELGEVVYAELPLLGKHAVAGEEAAVLESTKAAADIYSPVSGEVVEVNERAIPEINHAPETTGWLFKIKLSDRSELESLLSKDEYHKLIL